MQRTHISHTQPYINSDGAIFGKHYETDIVSLRTRKRESEQRKSPVASPDTTPIDSSGDDHRLRREHTDSTDPPCDEIGVRDSPSVAICHAQHGFVDSDGGGTDNDGDKWSQLSGFWFVERNL